MSKNLVSVGKGLEAKSQSRGGTPSSSRGGDKRRMSGDGASKRSPSGKPDSASRQDLLAGLPNIKRSPTLSEWTDLLDGDVTEGGALAEGTRAQSLKGYASGSHTSGVASAVTQDKELMVIRGRGVAQEVLPPDLARRLQRVQGRRQWGHPLAPRLSFN
jgi:hypothetical protein